MARAVGGGGRTTRPQSDPQSRSGVWGHWYRESGILIVDDDEAIRETLALVLRRERGGRCYARTGGGDIPGSVGRRAGWPGSGGSTAGMPSPEDSGGRPVGNPGPTGGASYLPVPDAMTVDAAWASFMFGVVIRPLLLAAESSRSSNERYVERSRFEHE